MNEYLIDTFISRKAQGSPVKLFVLPYWPEYSTLQKLSKEADIPVTAFVKTEAGVESLQIRYFTNTGELPACGHATLAAAGIIAELYKKSAVDFITVEHLTIRCVRDNEKVFMTYPRYESSSYPSENNLLAILKLSSVRAVFFNTNLETVFVELNKPEELRSFVPDLDQLKSSVSDVKELVLTSASDITGVDFLLRSFCPWIGIDEDPVTGSVHSVLTPFWTAKTGKTDLIAWQASAAGGEVFVRDMENYVEIGGRIRVLKAD